MPLHNGGDSNITGKKNVQRQPATIASMIRTYLTHGVFTYTEKISCSKAGDIVQRMHTGYKKKLNDKVVSIIFLATTHLEN